MWDLILSVPDHCLSFYFASKVTEPSILDRVALVCFIRQETW